jgi:hypothetical protein
MAFDLFGRSRKPEKEEEEPVDPDSTKERTPEEEALLQKAREEAALRASERREEAGDVADLLGGMLDASAPLRAKEPGERDEGPPSVDLVLDADVESPEEKSKPGDFLSPFAALTEDAGPAVVRVPRAEDRPEGRIPGPELSPLMRVVRRKLEALGRSGSDPRPDFEPESAAEDNSRTMAVLAQGRRKHPVGLTFEPEDAAEQSGGEAASVPTRVMPAAEREAAASQGATPGDPDSVVSREYSLDDLPESEFPGAGPGDEEEPSDGGDGDSLQEGELGSAELLDARPQDDEGPATPPEAGAPASEADLDERALEDALAAVDRVAPEGTSPGAAAGSRTAPTAPDAPPGAPEKEYGLEDLPPAPDGGAPTEPSDERLTADDRIFEQSLTDLAAPAPAPPPSQAGPGGLTALERALDDSVEPSDEVPATPRSDFAFVGSERAADLSVEQLAAVERIIEDEVEVEEREAQQAEEKCISEERLAVLLGRLRRLTEWLGSRTAVLREVADAKLAPYSLNCKVLLGIVGVITLAVIGALSVKTWLLPTWTAPGG